MPILEGGVWVAYHGDWSGFAMFGTEIDAMRHAVGNHMSCAYFRFGEEMPTYDHRDHTTHLKETT